MIITEELDINGFAFEGDGRYTKTEIKASNQEVELEVQVDGDMITLTSREKDEKGKEIVHTDEIDTGMLQRLEVNRGMSNPLAYVLSQLVSYGEIQKV